MGRFAGKTFLVTGASSGIGRAVSVAIDKDGGRVVLLGRDEEKLKETLAMLNVRQGHVPVSFDLTDFSQYNTFFSQLKEQGIVLDGMVHCAGTTSILPLRILNVNNATEMFNIHFFSFLELVKRYSKKGISNGGSIVGISAISAHVPQKCMTAYAAAKAAMESACRTLSLELVEKNIRINSVVVGGVKSAMSEKVTEILQGMESNYENPTQHQLLGIATPEQIVGPILFLLSEDSSYITVRELYADGGLLG